MKIWIHTLIFLFPFSFVLAQPYTDYIGAGHSKGIVVSSSDEEERNFFYEDAAGSKTIDGSGLNGKKVDMARFLTQAALGYDAKDLDASVELGIEGWIDQQMSIERSKYLAVTDSFAQVLYDFYIAQGEDPNNISNNPGWQHFRYSWWNNAVFGKDQLRQRVAYALSQILVISDQTDLGGHARGLAS
ncbi:MAG TPA: DUF1800 family protein, partial [Saprospiraceae bacterium]|nr:DUF1800 family protein [Saprospiraceae bacterium]